MQCVCFILLRRRGYGRILIDVISIKAQALTGHKAQGCKWDTVIMNMWMLEIDLRFLHTRITRVHSATWHRQNLYI